MKYYLLFLISTTMILSADIKVYQYSGVDVNHNGKKVTLEREIHPKCLDIPISYDIFGRAIRQ